jgi:hypothetical protein
MIFSENRFPLFRIMLWQGQGIAGVEIIFSQKNDTRFDRNYDKMAVTSNGLAPDGTTR